MRGKPFGLHDKNELMCLAAFLFRAYSMNYFSEYGTSFNSQCHLWVSTSIAQLLDSFSWNSTFYRIKSSEQIFYFPSISFNLHGRILINQIIATLRWICSNWMVLISSGKRTATASSNTVIIDWRLFDGANSPIQQQRQVLSDKYITDRHTLFCSVDRVYKKKS